MIDLTLNETGDTVGIEKAPQQRTAKAVGYINMGRETIRMIADGAASKGDILSIARIAGIQAAKQSSLLFPLHHASPLTHVRIDFDIDLQLARVKATATAGTEGRHDGEIEALTAANIALLAIYDMLKTIDGSMVISQIHIEEKSGGQKEDFVFSNELENLNY